MESTKKIIKTRIGEREIDLAKVISFPRGIIGFEDNHDFILLEIKEDVPFLMMQSLKSPHLGLLVADPYSFTAEYKPRIDAGEKKLLQVKTEAELAVLVTVSIPPGKPEEMSLNLLGPIFINHEKQLGAQIAQTDKDIPERLLMRTLEVEEGEE